MNVYAEVVVKVDVNVANRYSNEQHLQQLETSEVYGPWSDKAGNRKSDEFLNSNATVHRLLWLHSNETQNKGAIVD